MAKRPPSRSDDFAFVGELEDAEPGTTIGPELIAPLGKIVVNGQALELTITVLLAQSLGISESEGALVASRLGISGALGLIRSLSERTDYPLDASAVQKWLAEATRAVEARNRAVHQAWLTEDKMAFTAVLTRDLQKEKRSPSELHKVVKQLHAVLISGHALSQKGKPSAKPRR